MANAVLSAYVAALCFLCVVSAQAQETVKLDVYYESKCPDSKHFFENELLPTYQKMPKILEISLIPYGNAHYSGQPGKYKFTCQHGPDECYGNIVQTCYIHLVNDTLSRIQFINCAFNAPSQDQSLEKCIECKKMRYKVQKCADSSEGNEQEYEMAKKTDALNPPHEFIPWITFNGKGSKSLNDKANQDLMSVICDELKDKPDACNKKQWNILKSFRNNYL